MPTYHLQPVTHDMTGQAEVLVCHASQIVGHVPQPSEPPERWLAVDDVTPCSWSPAHMALLFGYIGSNRHSVAIVRPVGPCLHLFLLEP